MSFRSTFLQTTPIIYYEKDPVTRAIRSLARPYISRVETFPTKPLKMATNNTPDKTIHPPSYI